MLDNNSAIAQNAIDDSKPKNTRAMTGFPWSQAKEINSRYAGQQLGNRAQRHRRQQAEKHQGHDRFPLFPSKRNVTLLCWTTTLEMQGTPSEATHPNTGNSKRKNPPRP